MRGFSLVELSIVLVILGLLTGGILAGQSLIRASELRAVTAEYQRYVAATQTFRDKYFAVPGDFRDASKFWGRQVAAAHCPTNSSAAVASPGACDGDGNGYLLDNAPAASQSGEVYQFWKQLANAGLIEGSYTGLAGTGGTDHFMPGTNIPRSKINNGAWLARSIPGYFAGDASAYAGDYGNYFLIGAPSASSWLYGSLLKPEEAWNIDTKMDDGRPGYGSVVPYYWNNGCATGGASASDLANSVYRLDTNSIQCPLYFRRAF